MNFAEAVERLGVSDDQLRGLIERGWVRSHRVDEYGNLCRHRELLADCQCDFDAGPLTWNGCQHFIQPGPCRCKQVVHDDDVRALGWIGTVDPEEYGTSEQRRTWHRRWGDRRLPHARTLPAYLLESANSEGYQDDDLQTAVELDSVTVAVPAESAATHSNASQDLGLSTREVLVGGAAFTAFTAFVWVLLRLLSGRSSTAQARAIREADPAIRHPSLTQLDLGGGLTCFVPTGALRSGDSSQPNKLFPNVYGDQLQRRRPVSGGP